jgi:hypothetical protein
MDIEVSGYLVISSFKYSDVVHFHSNLSNNRFNRDWELMSNHQ